MSTLKRVAAGASAVALAGGMTIAGVGVATAQDNGDGGSGSLPGGSLNLGDTAADLELAAQAFNGPVTVSGNAEGGPTVTYTNENDVPDRCVGLTMPYSTVAELDLDPGELDLDDIDEGLALLAAIEAEGGTAGLTTDGPGGEPISTEGGLGGVFVGWFGGTGIHPAPGETDTWEAVAPTDEPAAAVVFCNPDGNDDIANWGIYFGIDPQVVADQINDRIPGGSLELVSPDMISGGSVEAGAGLLGTLGS